MEWLRSALSEILSAELRPLAAAGGVETRPRQQMAHCSTAAQRVGESLGAINGGWVRQKMGFNQICIFDRS